MNFEKLIVGVTYGPEEGVRYGEPEAGVVYVNSQNSIPKSDIESSTEKALNESCLMSPEIVKPVQTNDIEIITSDLLNFDLDLKRRVINIFDTESGEKMECTYFVGIVVRLRSGEVQRFQTFVDSDKIKEKGWLSRATYSMATIPSNKEEKHAFLDKVQRCIETPNVPTEIIYPIAGWRNVQNLGWKYVFQQGYVGGTEQLIHTRNDKYSLMLNKEAFGSKAIFDRAINMQNICWNGMTSLELLLFVHTSVLTTLFERAGFTIGFVFGIVGVTNSRKTSMAVAMAKIFDRYSNVADAEFATATECGIEKTLSLYKDGIVLIDDFKPGTNTIQQRSLDMKLDYLVRLYGNRVSKKRMLDFNTDGEKKYFPVNGCCVVTMEIVTGVQSTLSRMFISEINKNDVNNDILSVYQDQKWILPTHLYDFLLWVTEYFEETVAYIKNNFNCFRRKHNFQYGRYADMYATFCITAELLSNYAMERKFWNAEDKHIFLLKTENTLLIEFANMQNRIQRRDKAMLILDALRHALDSGQLKPTTLTDETCSLRLQCYEDENCIYIRSCLLKKLVNDYCKLYHEQSNIVNKDEVFSILERVQVIEIEETAEGREKSRKLPKQKGNTLRYLYLIKKRVAEIWSD